MNKLKFLYALLIVLVCGACSDDLEPDLSTPGGVEMDGDMRVSVLHLSSGNLDEWGPVTDAVFELVDPVNRNTFSFQGSMVHNPDLQVLGKDGAATCRIAIGSVDIPDGIYYVTVSGEGVPTLGPRRVKFSRCAGTELAAAPFDYEDLSGDGTAENPYLIGSSDDFLSFVYYLSLDPDGGCGRYFRQTASFELPRRSVMIDGRIWLPVSFSGHYDGGGYTLKSLIYQGASSEADDSYVGLFKELYSATVEHVNIENAMIVNAHSNVGILAGWSHGRTTINDVAISGTVQGCGDYVGGLFGCVTGSDHTLSDIDIKSLSVSGTGSNSRYIGGLIGYHANTNLTVTGVSTPDHVFSVTGYSYVGGIVGLSITPSTVTFSNITLEHTVDKESADVKVIYATDIYAGGIVGYLDRTNNPVTFENISIKCPVRGRSDVGSLAGHATLLSAAKISKTVLSSVVKGSVSVGGFFGCLSLPSEKSRLRILGDDNTTRFVVKSSAAADVEGETYVGGFVGYFDGYTGNVIFDGKVEIAINVTGQSEVGGAIGTIINPTDFNIGGFNFSSTTMRVTGDDRVGGVIGRLNAGTVVGPNVLDLSSRIPTADQLQSCYSGVVVGNTNVGGIIGRMVGSLTGAGSSASVTANSDYAGGICGYCEGEIAYCAFFGTVSCKKILAGIYAICEGSIYAKSCLNLADISGGDLLAGIAAHTFADSEETVKFEGCYNKGNLSGALGASGIAAWIRKDIKVLSDLDKDIIHIINCGNSGNITAIGDGDDCASGILGFSDKGSINVVGCANHGDVYSPNALRALGGVVGWGGALEGVNTGQNYIEQCMNSGKISSDGYNTYTGGVVGGLFYYAPVVRDCYNTGEVPSDTHDDTGGILGYAPTDTHIYRTFNSGKVADGNATVGTGHVREHSNNYYLAGTGKGWPSSTSVSAGDISKQSVYNDFDFDKVWTITSDGPRLRSCPFQYF